jgi:hypothetical protein
MPCHSVIVIKGGFLLCTLNLILKAINTPLKIVKKNNAGSIKNLK